LADDEFGEKTEDPTAKRLREARDRGQVAQSQDLGGVLALLAGTVLLLVMGGWIMRSLGTMVRSLLAHSTPGDPRLVSDVVPTLAWTADRAGRLMLPILVIMFVVGYVGQVIQVGFLLTAKPLEPKLSRLNPIEGVKRLFGKRSLVKSLVNSLKLVVVLVVGWLVVRRHLAELIALPKLGAGQGMLMVGRIALELALWLILLLLVLAIIDWIYQRWQHKQDLKMTKHEVKEERRSLDGDPEIKKRRMGMARDLAMQRVQSSVPQADVMVTNPTHFAVALRYDADEMRAPTVVAKGADFVALRIRQVAAAHGVPIVERPPLARGLYWGVEVGHEVPESFYEAVAEILAYVYRTEQEAAA